MDVTAVAVVAGTVFLWPSAPETLRPLVEVTVVWVLFARPRCVRPVAGLRPAPDRRRGVGAGDLAPVPGRPGRTAPSPRCPSAGCRGAVVPSPRTASGTPTGDQRAARSRHGERSCYRIPTTLPPSQSCGVVATSA